MQVVEHNPAKYRIGSIVNVSVRYPIGHYRVPTYMRGKQVKVVRVLGKYINPEEEAFGRNAGSKLWCYMVSIPQKDLWQGYNGEEKDLLEIEIFEPWLEDLKIANNE
jgi:nitrile hydratase